MKFMILLTLFFFTGKSHAFFNLFGSKGPSNASQVLQSCLGRVNELRRTKNIPPASSLGLVQARCMGGNLTDADGPRLLFTLPSVDATGRRTLTLFSDNGHGQFRARQYNVAGSGSGSSSVELNDERIRCQHNNGSAGPEVNERNLILDVNFATRNVVQLPRPENSARLNGRDNMGPETTQRIYTEINRELTGVIQFYQANYSGNDVRAQADLRSLHESCAPLGLRPEIFPQGGTTREVVNNVRNQLEILASEAHIESSGGSSAQQ